MKSYIFDPNHPLSLVDNRSRKTYSNHLCVEYRRSAHLVGLVGQPDISGGGYRVERRTDAGANGKNCGSNAGYVTLTLKRRDVSTSVNARGLSSLVWFV